MNYAYDKKIGNKIRELREKKRWTQEELAARLQTEGFDYLTRSALAKIEVGQRHIYAAEMKAFKEILGTTYDELFV